MFSLAMAFEVGQGIVFGPHEATAFAFAFAFAFSFSFLEVVVHVPSKLADGLVSEASPSPSGFSVLHIDMLGCFSLGHVGDSRIRKFFAVIVRGGLRVCASVQQGKCRVSIRTVLILPRHG